jgi:uncharacterized protein YkwD
MEPNPSAPHSRRFAGVVFACLIAAAAVAGPATTAAATVAPSAAAISAAESAMLTALNKDRAAAGLIAVRADSRLMEIARARSADMVANHYFSHTQPDGRDVFDILTQQHVTWYGAGEIIAWNTYPTSTTTTAANSQWMNSPGHHAIVVSTNYNYVGVGLAFDQATGRHYWTAVFLKGPDRTGAKATIGAAKITAGTSASNRRARITWSGFDIRLQVLTAGLRSFTVQRRVDDGAWTTIWSSTTLRAATFRVNLGHRSEFRVSAVDKKGNRGAWVSRVVDLR